MSLLDALQQFCLCHATPGDEGEVFALLKRYWQEQSLQVKELGTYCLIAHRPLTQKPRLLICGHADSPGYIVSELRDGQQIGVIALGGPSLKQDTAISLKTSTGVYSGILYALSEDEANDRHATYRCDIPADTGVQLGDRIAWQTNWREDEETIYSPFLDNRIGCAAVATYFMEDHSPITDQYDVIVAATALEEMTGFGAAVLAHQCQADVVVALDVTYTNAEQGVSFGQGPVLTMSDASVVLSPALRDRLLAACKAKNCPLQLEVYNFSGTDARAFPMAGSTATVVPILLATGGNHSAEESINKADLSNWLQVVDSVAQTLLEERSHG